MKIYVWMLDVVQFWHNWHWKLYFYFSSLLVFTKFYESCHRTLCFHSIYCAHIWCCFIRMLFLCVFRFCSSQTLKTAGQFESIVFVFFFFLPHRPSLFHFIRFRYTQIETEREIEIRLEIDKNNFDVVCYFLSGWLHCSLIYFGPFEMLSSHFRRRSSVFFVSR